MTLTERELATLRAALHCWQNELNYYMAEELQTYYPDLRGIEPLSADEVEALLCRIAGLEPAGSPQGRADGSVSNVSVSNDGTGGAS